jgi:hypothetical protein
MAKPVLSTKTRTESRLVQYASNVVKKSKENADLFPDATEKVTLLETALADYTNSLSEAAFIDHPLRTISYQAHDDRYPLNHEIQALDNYRLAHDQAWRMKLLFEKGKAKHSLPL